MREAGKTSGKCNINSCPYDKIQLSNGVWVCPAYYDSPMHGSSLLRFDTQEEMDADLEYYAEMSVIQYLNEVGRTRVSNG